MAEIEKITILPEFRDWALDVIKSRHEKEVNESQKIHESQNRAAESTQKRLDNLTKLRLMEAITHEEFVKERVELQSELAVLRSNVRHAEGRADEWQEYESLGWLTGFAVCLRKPISLASVSHWLTSLGHCAPLYALSGSNPAIGNMNHWGG